MSHRRPFVGGNWKMHNTRRAAAELTSELLAPLASLAAELDTFVYPAFVHLDLVARAIERQGTGLRLGAQNLYPEPEGAFTGEVSAEMLLDLGAESVLVGHSERRHVIGESDDLVARKTAAALNSGLLCVLCVGETLEQRESGQTDAVNERQVRSALHDAPRNRLANLVIAYEPVWAIGTGRTATPDDAQAAHAHIRSLIEDLFDENIAGRTRIIYGGSVKASNASSLFSQPDIDGGLIGGASLKAADFISICKAAASAPVGARNL